MPCPNCGSTDAKRNHANRYVRKAGLASGERPAEPTVLGAQRFKITGWRFLPVRLIAVLATAEWRIMNNTRVMLMRNDGKTRMWIAKTPGVFGGVPDFVWTRELPDDECKAVLENPWRMFDKPEPDGRAMFGA